MPRIFPQLTATRLQASAYLFGVALFSIAFLVFLNSIISFVVTDVIGDREHTGDIVGTLGFADELLALVACPLWGLLSDRIGVRNVAVTGYCIIGFSLICLVKSTNVYPELLLGRLGFSLGGAACSTMVTAALPTMVAPKEADHDDTTEPQRQPPATNGHVGGSQPVGDSNVNDTARHMATPSVSSELTITQTRYKSTSQFADVDEAASAGTQEPGSDTSQLAGFVGLFTGAGALLALLILLPLPALFQKQGQDQSQSVRTSFYIVGAIAFCVAVFVFFGLRDLPNENKKSFSALWQRPYDEDTKTGADGHLHTRLIPAPSYFALARDSLLLGFTDHNIGLAYVGGFVARASSVAISLFIPLFVKSYFIHNGFCDGDPNDPTDIKEHCRRAYTLASALSGVAETAALVCAPLFGWLGGKILAGRVEWPLLAAAAIGIGGHIAFGFLRNPDPFHGGGGKWAFIAVVMIGVNQIGTIVCSLALLGRGIRRIAEKSMDEASTRSNEERRDTARSDQPAESEPLLLESNAPLNQRVDRHEIKRRDRLHLKGSIAGMYSFVGGAGILLLNKLGGALFDSWTPGAPFFLLAIFNSVLFAIVGFVGIFKTVQRNRVER